MQEDVAFRVQHSISDWIHLSKKNNYGKKN